MVCNIRQWVIFTAPSKVFNGSGMLRKIPSEKTGQNVLTGF